MRLPFLFALSLALGCASPYARADCNSTILEILETMPSGGMYSVKKPAFDGLTRSINVQAGGIAVNAEAAQPSFCSGATYLVFVQTLARLQRSGALTLDPAALAALPVAGQRDGQGVWGRWNANGPGTARLFHELQLGRNFTDFAEARPGDFMKVFWTDEIGKKERGHSVIYLGNITANGKEYVRFWSSNLPSTQGDLSGYGMKLVPRTKMARVIFSRLEQPANVNRVATLTKMDTFLGSLLSRSVTFEEVRRMCGF